MPPAHIAEAHTRLHVRGPEGARVAPSRLARSRGGGDEGRCRYLRAGRGLRLCSEAQHAVS
eukprot:3490653-Rhodomonas_salina.1